MVEQTGISTHTPLARCDVAEYADWEDDTISTHTPLARCDGTLMAKIPRGLNFNSHTPREV